MAKKVDEEMLEDILKQLLKDNLAAKLTAITTEKGDSLELPSFTDEKWVDSLSYGLNNRGAFIYFSVESSDPVEPQRAGSTARTVTLVAFALVPKQNDPKARTKIHRVSRGFREVLEEKFKDTVLRSMSPLVISTLTPESVGLQDNNAIYWMGGIRFFTTLY